MKTAFAFVSIAGLFVPFALSYLMYLLGWERFLGISREGYHGVATGLFVLGIVLFFVAERLGKSKRKSKSRGAEHKEPRAPEPPHISFQVTGRVWTALLWEPPRHWRDLSRTGRHVPYANDVDLFWRYAGGVVLIPLVLPFLFYLNFGSVDRFGIVFTVGLTAFIGLFAMVGVGDAWRGYWLFRHGILLPAFLEKTEKIRSARRHLVRFVFDGQAHHALLRDPNGKVPDDSPEEPEILVLFDPGRRWVDGFFDMELLPGEYGTQSEEERGVAAETPGRKRVLDLIERVAAPIWAFSILLGPFIGWLISGVIVPLSPEDFAWRLGARAMLAVGLPVLSALALGFVVVTRTWRYGSIGALILTTLTALSAWTGWASLRDVVSGTESYEGSLVAFRHDDDIRGRWRTRPPGRSWPEGSFEGRLHDGRVFEFSCPPVCPRVTDGPRRSASPLGVPSRWHLLRHSGEVLRIEPIAPTPTSSPKTD